jgi:uncharacterized protein YggE
MPTTRFVLAGALVLAALSAVPAHAAEDSEPQRTISVSGSANLTAANDTAGFVTGVDVRRSSASAALKSASARMQHILDALAAQGIDRDDIQTRRTDVRRERRKHVVLYVATSTVSVTVRLVTRTGRAISAAIDAGANRLSGPRFWRSNTRDLYQRALVQALHKARAKAQALAADEGVTLGPVQNISEGTTPDYDYEQAASGGGSSDAAAPVRPGRTRVTADVSVVYALQ